MPDFPTRRNNTWHFVRRVPTEFAHLDKRGVVKHSTRIKIADDRAGRRAARVADRLNLQLELFWKGLADGKPKEELVNYDNARRSARALATITWRTTNWCRSGRKSACNVAKPLSPRGWPSILAPAPPCWVPKNGQLFCFRSCLTNTRPRRRTRSWTCLPTSFGSGPTAVSARSRVSSRSSATSRPTKARPMTPSTTAIGGGVE